jgi:hypothetical protein
MKVKFYKGPAHGKNREVHPQDRVVVVAVGSNLPVWNYSSDEAVEAYRPRTARYTKAFRLTEHGPIPCMHPDGSYFFEYIGE